MSTRGKAMDAAQIIFSVSFPVVLLAVTRWYEARRAEAAAAAARAARFAPLDVPPSPLAANFAHTGRVGHDTDSAGGLVFEPRRWAGNVPLPRVVRQVRG